MDNIVKLPVDRVSEDGRGVVLSSVERALEGLEKALPRGDSARSRTMLLPLLDISLVWSASSLNPLRYWIF